MYLLKKLNKMNKHSFNANFFFYKIKNEYLKKMKVFLKKLSKE